MKPTNNEIAEQLAVTKGRPSAGPRFVSIRPSDAIDPDDPDLRIVLAHWPRVNQTGLDNRERITPSLPNVLRSQIELLRRSVRPQASFNLAAHVAVARGGSRLAAIPDMSALAQSRVASLGTVEESWFRRDSWQFQVQTGHGGEEKTSVRIPVELRAELSALADAVGLEVGTLHTLAVVAALVDLEQLDDDVRALLQRVIREFKAALHERAKEGAVRAARAAASRRPPTAPVISWNQLMEDE